MNNYKEYVDKYNFPAGIDGDSVLDSEFGSAGIINFNPEGKLDLSMSDLYAADPRAALHILFGVLSGTCVIASEEVRLAMMEAFRDAIDFSNGGLTRSGHARYALNCGWLEAEAGMHRSLIQFEKIKHDPEAVKAWPKGIVADLGGRSR